MVQEKTPRAKSQSLSLRLDPKSRFVLEFLAKIKRQSITTVVEDAIREAGASGVVDPFDQKSRTWKNYWDVSEGVRRLRMLADTDIPSNYEDDELRDFVEHHIEFFSETNDLSEPDRINIHVLWPNIERYLKQWRETKRKDPWGVGRDMSSALEEAKVKPPQWPREAKAPPAKVAPSYADELDEEIPF